jgi:hypothetical protein
MFLGPSGRRASECRATAERRSLIKRLLWHAALVAILAIFLFDIKAVAQQEQPVTAGFGEAVGLEQPHDPAQDSNSGVHRLPRPLPDDQPRPLPRLVGGSGSSSAPESPGLGLHAYSKDEVRELIAAHAATFGLDAQLLIRIANCESGLRWNAANPSSSARGVFQPGLTRPKVVEEPRSSMQMPTSEWPSTTLPSTVLPHGIRPGPAGKDERA